MDDTMPPYVVRRRNALYFRMRIGKKDADVLGKEIVVSLKTADVAIARQRMAPVLATFHEHMKQSDKITRDSLLEALQEAVLSTEMIPPREHPGKKASRMLEMFAQPGVGELLRQNMRQAEKLAGMRAFMQTGKAPEAVRLPNPDNPEDAQRWIKEVTQRTEEAAEDLGFLKPWFQEDVEPDTSKATVPVKTGREWQDYQDEFWLDNPHYSPGTIRGIKTSFSYVERVWQKKPLVALTKRDLVQFSDFLRDYVNDRGKSLNVKTMQRHLGEIRAFLRWAVGKDYLKDDGFETVRTRRATREELRAEDKRRPFSRDELKHFFLSPKIRERRHDERWWLAVILAMTGARGGEILSAPSQLVMIGDVACIDLRQSGTKTANASRLVPVITELEELGFLDYAAQQYAQGRPLVYGESSSGKQRTASAALAGLNRVVHEIFPEEKALLGYSFRHHFRQMLSASGIGLELSNKVFGHRGGETYERYGKGLSESEAVIFREKVHFPFSLKTLLDDDESPLH